MNKYHESNADSIDKLTTEYAKFNERRESPNKATIISDYLILQTSSGDQSILYFQKDSNETQSQIHFDKVEVEDTELWDNNPESASNMAADGINIGSYNGKFFSPSEKYKGSGNQHQTITVFDNDPANKVTRPNRPTHLRLVKEDLNIIDTIPNEEYLTGNAKVFYRNLLNHRTSESQEPNIYSSVYDADFSSSGIINEAPYSDNHAKVNDIVIQNPVSAQDAMVVSNDKNLDQRTADTQSIGGNLQSDTEEYVTQLKESHNKQNFIINGDAEQTTPSGLLVNWIGEASDKTGVNFTRRADGRYTISGTSSLEINVPSGSNRLAKYTTTTVGLPNSSYDFSGRLAAHRCYGYFTIEALDENDIVLQTYKTADYNQPTPTTQTLHFTTTANTSKLRVSIVNDQSSDSNPSYGDYIFADDLSLTLTDGNTRDWIPVSYITTMETTVNNPHYIPAQDYDGARRVYNYIGSYNTYTIPVDGRYTLETWGAKGGSSGGLGGYSYDEKDFTAGELLYIYPGGSGGWNGGGSGHGRYSQQGGGGGSGYIGSLINAYMRSGNETVPNPNNPSQNQTGNNGDGVVVITEPEIHIPEQGPRTITTTSQITKSITSPPDSWYETVIVTIPANPNVTLPGVGNIFSSDLLTLDYPFKVYFPNIGDFKGNNGYGLSRTSRYRGKGYEDAMDTTEWTAAKYAQFDFNVIYKGSMYPSGYKIPLEPVEEEWFDFYLPLSNREAISAGTKFSAIAINANGFDYNSPTNKYRDNNLESRHSAIREYNIDLVGRIGNLIMEDTGDYRFSNFFKEPISPLTWSIKNLTYKVDTTKQRAFLGPQKDIRNIPVSSTTHYLNTYGTVDFLEERPKNFPLIPTINNIAAFRRQPLRFGYPIFMDIETIGNYYSKMEIVSYYYHLNLLTGDLTPVDVYMKVNENYEAINIFDAAKPGWNPNSVYPFRTGLNWVSEAKRRNYSTEEEDITEEVRKNIYSIDDNDNVIPIGMPMGEYHTYGNAQLLNLNERNRTFIGSTHTYGDHKNPGDYIPTYQYNMQAQRWHFTMKLPSSAIFSPHGLPINQANVESVMNNTSVIVASADIKAYGDTYALQYKHPTGNGSITISGRTHSLEAIPYNVYAIYSAEKSSANDLSISGTH